MDNWRNRVFCEDAVKGIARLPDGVADLIIADPPWVPRDLTTDFPEDPLTAIDGGPDGLDVARACLDVVAGHLADGGSAILQLGTTAQADALGEHDAFLDGRLDLSEVRREERGVLARIDRPTTAG